MSPLPAPYILDLSVLIAYARFDIQIAELVQILDARQQPLVVPALTLAGALEDVATPTAKNLFDGLVLMGSVQVAPLNTVDHAAILAEAVSVTGLDVWDAHTAAVANRSVCPILTVDVAKWRPAVGAFEHPLHVVEIEDLPDGD